MKMQKTIATLLAMTAFGTIAVEAQTQDMFRAQVTLTCKPSHGKNSRMTNQDFIRACVGTGFTKKEISRNFQLVYNSTTDSLQVVNASDGSVVCDVFQFEGGENIVANAQLQRLVFVFVPGNGTAVGSAAITEKANGNKNVARISAKIQVTLSEPAGDGTTIVTASVTNSDGQVTSDLTGSFVESVAVTTSSGAQVCTGTFTVGKAFVAGANIQSTKAKRHQQEQVIVQTPVTQINNTTNQTTTVLTNVPNTTSIPNVSGSITNLGNTTMFNAFGF